MERRTKITGMGTYLPKVKVPNTAFLDHSFYNPQGERIQKANSDIVEKLAAISEIEERRYAGKGVSNVDMAYEAALMAIERAGIDPETLDQIIFAHNFGNVSEGFPVGDLLPNMGARLKHKLGIRNSKCIAYDLLFGCPGWLQGMIQAHQFISSGVADRILVVGSDLMSRLVDPHDLDSMLFSDGAGATVVEAVEGRPDEGVLAYSYVSDCGEEVNYLCNGPGNKRDNGHAGDIFSIKMVGRNVYKYSLEKVPAAICQTLDKAGVSLAEVSKILIHQANGKMIKQIVQKLYHNCGHLEVPEDILPISVHKLGNSSVATIPTLWTLIEAGKVEGHSLEKGKVVVLTSVGAGMHANCMVYRL